MHHTRRQLAQQNPHRIIALTGGADFSHTAKTHVVAEQVEQAAVDLETPMAWPIQIPVAVGYQAGFLCQRGSWSIQPHAPLAQEHSNRNAVRHPMLVDNAQMKSARSRNEERPKWRCLRIIKWHIQRIAQVRLQRS